MESSSSPTPKKDDDEKIPTTLVADESHGDEPANSYPVSSPRNLFLEAVKAILRCLGFGGENASGTQVAVCEKKSDEGQKNVKDDSSSSPNEDAGDGQGAGSVASDLPQSSVAYDLVPAATEADDPPAGDASSDPPPGAAQDDPPAAVATTSLAFRRPTRPFVNPGQGGQIN